MGLFFNYDKPGPGVDKNAPKKKGMFLFFDLLGRNLTKLILANILYFIVSLPIVVIYFMIVSTFFGTIMPEALGTTMFSHLAIVITLLITILWGTGPVSCGYTYILRNTAREEHTFLASDFFEKSKENFLNGIVFLIIDAVLLISSLVAILVYWKMAEQTGGIFIVLLFVIFLMLLIYTLMHFYMYELAVTFTDKPFRIYKNSLLMAFATLPVGVFITAIICISSLVLLSFLTPIAVLIVASICWISVMRFMVDFYSARVIKKNFLTKDEQTEQEK